MTDKPLDSLPQTLRETAKKQDIFALEILLNLAANRIEELENDLAERTKERSTED